MTPSTGLSCRTARQWLQAPEGLAVPDALSLTRHLAQCGLCQAYQSDLHRLDTRLLSSLDTAIAGRSVRTPVMAELHGKSSLMTSSRKVPGVFAPRRIHVFSFSMAIMLGIVLALFMPQLLSRQGQQTPQAIAWRAMHAEVGFPMSVDQKAPNHLLVGARGRVYETRDAGNSWKQLTPLPAGNVIRSLVIDTGNTSHYLVATKHSMYVSVDAGRHWALTARSLPGAMNMFLSQALQHNTFYLGPSVLWKSTDSGRSWHSAGPGYVFAPDGIQALSVAPNGDLVAGIWAGGVAISHDGGRSWHRQMHGLPRNVMDVEAPSAREIWAGTDRGLYHSGDGGLTWKARGLRRVRVTSLLVRRGAVLAGGVNALYRSVDQGKTWLTVTDGLPLDPYVAGFSGTSDRPNQVFASLNTDGVFRSDDGGQTWKSVSAGLPLRGDGNPARAVPFLRQGRLWVTTSAGADPGLLTFDSDVHDAAVSPDGLTAAYVTGTSRAWVVRVLSAGGGSLAHVIVSGSGALPDRIDWSPTSTMLALPVPHSLVISDLHGGQSTWAPPKYERLLDWAPGGRSLLFWNVRSGRVTERSWHGLITGGHGGRYPALPTLAPDRRRLAFTYGGALRDGTWMDVKLIASVSTRCRVVSWSDDSVLLLLSCGRRWEIRTRDGRLERQATMTLSASWAPASHDVLLFRDGALWRWDQQGMHRVVADALPAASVRA